MLSSNSFNVRNKRVHIHLTYFLLSHLYVIQYKSDIIIYKVNHHSLCHSIRAGYAQD